MLVAVLGRVQGTFIPREQELGIKIIGGTPVLTKIGMWN